MYHRLVTLLVNRRITLTLFCRSNSPVMSYCVSPLGAPLDDHVMTQSNTKKHNTCISLNCIATEKRRLDDTV